MDLLTQLNQPLGPAALAVVMALCLVGLVLLLKLGRKQSRAVSAKILAEHPDAATLYVYAQDLDKSGGEVECIHGTASKLFDSIDVPQPPVRKGVACHLLPGHTELLVTLTLRDKAKANARCSFEVLPRCSYGVVFTAADKSAKLVRLDGGQVTSL